MTLRTDLPPGRRLAGGVGTTGGCGRLCRGMTAPADTKLVIAQVKNEAELFQALAIREVVFIEEQHVPETIERDAEDARAYHLLAFAEGHAIGTGRLVVLPAPPPGETGTWGQIGRMAVLQSERQHGVGNQLL